jgi:hypothetical protein
MAAVMPNMSPWTAAAATEARAPTAASPAIAARDMATIVLAGAGTLFMAEMLDHDRINELQGVVSGLLAAMKSVLTGLESLADAHPDLAPHARDRIADCLPDTAGLAARAASDD